MKTIILSGILMLCASVAYAQPNTNDFNTKAIDKKVETYKLQINLSTPLHSFLSMQYILISGKQSLWREISSDAIIDKLPAKDSPDKEVTPQKKKEYLNYSLLEIITYKDSTAAVIAYTNTQSKPYYLIYWCKLEDGKWKNRGQDPADTIENARRNVRNVAANF